MKFPLEVQLKPKAHLRLFTGRGMAANSRSIRNLPTIGMHWTLSIMNLLGQAFHLFDGLRGRGEIVIAIFSDVHVIFDTNTSHAPVSV